MTHSITGSETFLHHTLASIGVPPLHIIRAYNATEYRFYELSGLLTETLHFAHFKKTELKESRMVDSKIRLGEELLEKKPAAEPIKPRISLLDE